MRVSRHCLAPVSNTAAGRAGRGQVIGAMVDVDQDAAEVDVHRVEVQRVAVQRLGEEVQHHHREVREQLRRAGRTKKGGGGGRKDGAFQG